ncbi:MAG: ABC transporter substrate-binding protein [Candidatus Rokuibacteriota bacterium]
MRRLSRRLFLQTAAGVGAGIALAPAPAFAQKRELTFLSFNHFVPASDDELRRQADVFGKQAGVIVRVDTIAGPQLPAKRAAQVASQSGHDLVVTTAADPFLFESHLVDMGDLIDHLGPRYGGWYPFVKEACQTTSGWRAVPWFWVSFPASYNEAHFKKAGLPTPKTWDELLKSGKILKKHGHPVGIPISHCTDANISFWSVLWCYGGKVLEADGKTPAINSDKAAQVVEWYKELYRDAMEPEVLSWDNASNNRHLLSGKGSWIHNPISPYVAAVTKQMPIADDINHHGSPGGPAGIHSAPGIVSVGIWKFSKNATLAKDFIKFLFQKENYDAFIVAGSAFNQPPLKGFAEHPIWASNPKYAMLPKEADYVHEPGWPAKPNTTTQLIWVNFTLPDIVAKAINGMPTKRALAWGEDQVKLAVQGKLKKEGSS